MKASEIIKALEDAIKYHGDLEAFIMDSQYTPDEVLDVTVEINLRVEGEPDGPKPKRILLS
jgi:hypothetical protein